VRVHCRERRELFTRLRVSGSPPARELFSCRVTTRMRTNNKEQFRIIDAWTNRECAHRVLARPWTGSTSFVLKQPAKHESEGACARANFDEYYDGMQPTRGSVMAAVTPVRGSEASQAPGRCSCRGIQNPFSGSSCSACDSSYMFCA